HAHAQQHRPALADTRHRVGSPTGLGLAPRGGARREDRHDRRGPSPWRAASAGSSAAAAPDSAERVRPPSAHTTAGRCNPAGARRPSPRSIAESPSATKPEPLGSPAGSRRPLPSAVFEDAWGTLRPMLPASSHHLALVGAGYLGTEVAR